MNWTDSAQQKDSRERQAAKDMGISGKVADNQKQDSLKPKQLPK